MVCFRTGIVNKTYIDHTDHMRQLFNASKLFIVEICSNKKYIHGGFYLHHLAIDKRFSEYNTATPADILASHTVEKQDDAEVEADILEIQRLLAPTRIVIVSHYNSKQNGQYIAPRNDLICLLERICVKHAIPFVNPTSVLAYPQAEVMTSDLGHYTEKGISEFSKYMNNYIRELGYCG